MKITLKNISLLYDIQCVCLLFFPRVSFSKEDGKELLVSAENEGIFVSFSDGKTTEAFYPFQSEYDFFRTAVKLAVYDVLSRVTGKESPWGIITGIRPAVLFEKLQKQSPADAEEIFKNRYKVSVEKTNLCKEVLEGRKRAISENKENDVSIYISIPFCPSRCAYCSFVSSSTEKERALLEEYVSLLTVEIEEKKNMILADGKNPTTLYIGGGTPSVLNEDLLERLMVSVQKNLLSPFNIREFSFEAGRPDTINEEKLKILSSYGVNRISINPQTLNNSVLSAVRRRHTAEDFFLSYEMAAKYPFIINTDLIAGLPTDTPESFFSTTEKLLALSPENITVHTLYLKRAADFGAEENALQVKKASEESGIEEMLSYIDLRRKAEGYIPYYLYKQKNTVENMENIGYSKEGKECLYNIYMMDDIHDIYGIGAGAVSKKIDRETNNVKRNSNTKFAYNYIKEKGHEKP